MNFFVRYLIGSGKTAMELGVNPFRFVLGRVLGLVSAGFGVLGLGLSFLDAVRGLGGVLGLIGFGLAWVGLRMIRRGKILNYPAIIGIVLGLAGILVGFGLVGYFV